MSFIQLCNYFYSNASHVKIWLFRIRADIMKHPVYGLASSKHETKNGAHGYGDRNYIDGDIMTEDNDELV